MIRPECNTLFSSLLSQKESWTPSEVSDIAKSVISPFKDLNLNNIEQSNDVLMLHDIADILPAKISCYKQVVEKISKNNGLACSELELNIFNSDCGLDSIAFIYALVNHGYASTKIKRIRLFCNNNEAMRRSLLLHKYIYPHIETIPYLLDINEIKDECQCNSFLTINIFPHTYNLGKDIAKTIGKLLIESNQIYSHSIFFEFVDCYLKSSISSFDYSYFLQDLNQTKFVKLGANKYKYRHKLKLDDYSILPINANLGIFSNLSVDDLELNHEYKIVLGGLCPGVPQRKLFNEKQLMLFFDTPFKDNNSINDQFDNSIVVASEENFRNNCCIDNYTTLDAIKKFPQYLIAEALDEHKEWASVLYDFYLKSAQEGNSKCYNNLAVINLLRNSLAEDANNLESEANQTIINLLNEAIKGNDIDAMINLASLYMSRNKLEKAFKYYELAYNNGSSAGAYSVGVAFNFGLCGVIADTTKAIDCYRKSLDFIKIENTEDSASFNSGVAQNCCLNLILLMYQEKYSLCDITKEYNKVENPNDTLLYAYTVISNNLSNKSINFFKTLKILDSPKNVEPSYVTYNRLCALYNGIRIGNDKLDANPKLAYERLKELANSGCSDWPKWEDYIWNKLANWGVDLKESKSIITTYWLKATKANSDGECAYKTNIANFGNVSEEERKNIWHKFAFGNGCKQCNECTNYDSTARCCPKAQLIWAKLYETDNTISDYLLQQSVEQGYTTAINEVAINRVYKAYDSSIKVESFENFKFSRFGIIPECLDKCIDIFDTPYNYKLLCNSAHQGSRKAASILKKITEKNSYSEFEHIYWCFVAGSIRDSLQLLSKLSNRSIKDGYFQAETLLEIDYILIAKKVAEQFIGTKESAFEHLKELAEFYVQGENYKYALKLYNIAREKDFDVSERIEELELIIEQEEERYRAAKYRNYNYYDDYDYGADTWDALTDGMYGDYPGPGVDYDALGF